MFTYLLVVVVSYTAPTIHSYHPQYEIVSIQQPFYTASSCENARKLLVAQLHHPNYNHTLAKTGTVISQGCYPL